MSGDCDLIEFLAEEGFRDSSAQRAALAVLQAQRLTRPGKSRMALTKIARAREVLAESLILLCPSPACSEVGLAKGRRAVRAAERRDCEACGGSDNRRAIDDMFEAVKRARISRLVVVGGSPETRRQLRELVDGRLELRLVDGTERRTQIDADADLKWADLVLIWGGTELSHGVSRLYCADRQVPRVTVRRRGVAAVAKEVIEHLARRGGGSPGRHRPI